MSPWRILAEALGQRVDAELIPALYQAASAPTAEIREELRGRGYRFVDVEAGELPEADELARTVAYVVKSSSRLATAVGVVAGAVGGLAIAPELAASAVATLRMAQRLAVVHGFDPDLDSGKIVISRAVAAAYDVRLPGSARVATRVSELPVLARAGEGSTRALAAWVGNQVATGSAWVLAGRVIRLVPGLGATIGGVGAWRRQGRVAERMCEVYARATESIPFDLSDESLALELPTDGS